MKTAFSTRPGEPTEEARVREGRPDETEQQRPSPKGPAADRKGDRRGKRRFPFFWVIYGLLLGAFFVALGVGISWMNRWLADFEKNQERAVLERYFEKLRQGDYGDHLIVTDFRPTRFAPLSDYTDYLREKYRPEDEYVFYAGERTDDGAHCYEVFRGEEPLGRVWLRQLEQKSEYGFAQWQVQRVNDFTMEDEFVFQAPQDASVWVTGVLLGEEDVAERIPDDFPDASAYGLASSAKVIYKIPAGMLLGAPAVTVRGYDGSDCEVFESQNEGHLIRYRHPLRHREELEEQTIAVSEMLTTIVARSQSGDIRPYLEYLVPGTEYYSSMKDWKKHWYWTATEARYVSHTIEDRSIDAYEEWDENRVTVRIRYRFLEKTDKNTLLDFPIRYEIHWICIDGVWKILSQTNY